MTAPTLLERRREQRDEAVTVLLHRVKQIEAIVTGNADASALHMQVKIQSVESAARDASHFAALVADLEDVANYGAGGGRA